MSHRWCQEKHPDDADQAKYHLLCRGLCAIVARDGLDAKEGYLWIDQGEHVTRTSQGGHRFEMRDAKHKDRFSLEVHVLDEEDMHEL